MLIDLLATFTIHFYVFSLFFLAFSMSTRFGFHHFHRHFACELHNMHKTDLNFYNVSIWFFTGGLCHRTIWFCGRFCWYSHAIELSTEKCMSSIADRIDEFEKMSALSTGQHFVQIFAWIKRMYNLIDFHITLHLAEFKLASQRW